MYVWWTCNQKCTYCMEFQDMERQWTKKVSKYEILKNLIKYKKKGYNHVTYLWWEPFIQAVFWDALLLGQKMWFTILVTTNATTLHLEKEANKYLPYIDELILSVEAIDINLQQKISRTKVIVHWEKVFENINKFWTGSYLKVNIVITQDNLSSLYDIVKYLISKDIKNIAITYPDLDLLYYWKEHLETRVAPTYTEAMKEVIEIEKYCSEYRVSLKIVDFPFCIFPKDKLSDYIKKTDEIDYWNRLKVATSILEQDLPERTELDRKDFLPRERKQIDVCKNCNKNDICWWPAMNYKVLYWYNEIKPIENGW